MYYSVSGDQDGVVLKYGVVIDRAEIEVIIRQQSRLAS